MAEAGLARTELRRRALATPEEPFLFFRGGRGHFRWWSFARAARELDRREGTVPDPPGAATARELLAVLADAESGVEEAARELLERLGPGAERDIWISWRPLAAEAERALALAALLGGWAVLREPAEPLPAATLAWARPTVLTGRATEVAALLDGLVELAPRAFRGRWLRRRLARLRAVVVDEAGATAALGRRLAELGAPARALSWPAVGW